MEYTTRTLQVEWPHLYFCTRASQPCWQTSDWKALQMAVAEPLRWWLVAPWLLTRLWSSVVSSGVMVKCKSLRPYIALLKSLHAVWIAWAGPIPHNTGIRWSHQKVCLGSGSQQLRLILGHNLWAASGVVELVEQLPWTISVCLSCLPGCWTAAIPVEVCLPPAAALLSLGRGKMEICNMVSLTTCRCQSRRSEAFPRICAISASPVPVLPCSGADLLRGLHWLGWEHRHQNHNVPQSDASVVRCIPDVNPPPSLFFK